MSKKESAWTRFTAWVNGEHEPAESRLFSMGMGPRKERRPEITLPKREEKQRLHGFLSWYPVASAVIGVILVGILLATVLVMPPFGEVSNPTNNEVPAHYLLHTREETGASNAVAGMILNYRGFDTFGESCVLFLAVSSVFILLLRDENNTSQKDLEQAQRQDRRRKRRQDVILQEAARLLSPFILLFGAYMLLGGHHSPGGGFSGGAVLGGALILYAAAFGQDAIRRFFNEKVYNTVRVIGLMLYAVLFGYYIFTGANGLDNHIPLEYGGLILPIDIAVGLVVACTMYGFYAMFTRGEL